MLNTYLTSKYDTVIIADGLFPRSEFVISLIRDTEIIICCDGATHKAVANGFVPDYIVGDLDSLDEKHKQLYADKLIHFPEQDTNDLTKAVQFAVSKGSRKTLIVGATGLREDHTLGNISLLIRYIELFEQVEMVSDYGIFTAITHTCEIESFQGQQVSLFSLDHTCPISTQGLKYPVSNRKFQTWWEGTLNESLGDSFLLRLHREGQMIVFRAF